jgi:hypothetical protein
MGHPRVMLPNRQIGSRRCPFRNVLVMNTCQTSALSVCLPGKLFNRKSEQKMSVKDPSVIIRVRRTHHQVKSTTFSYRSPWWWRRDGCTTNCGGGCAVLFEPIQPSGVIRRRAYPVMGTARRDCAVDGIRFEHGSGCIPQSSGQLLCHRVGGLRVASVPGE